MKKEISERWSKIRCTAFLIGLNLVTIVLCAIGSQEDYSMEYVQEIEVEEEDIIRWKQEEVSVEVLQIDVVEKPVLESLGEYMLTAYCPCSGCSANWGTKTSTGKVTEQGRTVAVDPEVIPYGTVLVINDMQYIAEDCGGAIKGKRIDVYFDKHEDALEFGVQYAEVFVKGN